MLQIRSHLSRSRQEHNPERVEPAQLLARLDAGDRCVRYEWCCSLLLATLRRQSAVRITKTRRERILHGFGFSLLALLLGPWGVPWGLVWTPWAIWINLTGGVDVTAEIRESLRVTPDDPTPEKSSSVKG